jgi:hypothetical protein
MAHDTQATAASSPPPPPVPPKPPQLLVLRLAAHAACDPRTAKKAMTRGSDAVEGLLGQRIAESMKALGIADPAEARKP